ncbi:MAG: deoxyribose-phosphate aldolase, partial [Chlamydiia bacterium]|nr:deoxyribose-phosphate aldolase [Chlamydiia bacterium]
MIDYTNLKPEATTSDIETLCLKALEKRFFAVCVASKFVPFAYSLLKNSSVKVCAVVGFPHGNQATEVKAFEARFAVSQGAAEIDMVISLGEAKAGNWDAVEADIRAVCEATRVPVKAILETCLLTDEEVVKGCETAIKGGAAFVKTSTGFSLKGADLETVRLMKSVVGERAGIKASGGIRTQEQIMAFLGAGATRIG